MTQLKIALGSALLVLFATGCTTRQVVRFEDHKIQNKTFLETNRIDNYFVYAKSTHEFWLCEDGPDTLSCTPTCNGKTDLECPMDGATVAFASD